MPNLTQQSSAEQKTPQTPVTSTADDSLPTKDKLSAVTKYSKILRLLLIIGAGLLIIVSVIFSVLNVHYYDYDMGWVIPNIVASAFMILMAVWSGKSLNNVNYNKLDSTVTFIMAGFILILLKAIFNIFYYHYFDYDYEDRFLLALDVFAIVLSLVLLVIALKLRPFLSSKRRIKVIGIAGIMGIVILAILLVFTRTKYPDEVLFHGLPVTRFLEMTRDDVIKEFGEPRDRDRRGEYYRFPGEEVGGIRILYNNYNGKIIFVSILAQHLTFNRRDLHRITPRMVIRLLPNPLRMSTNYRSAPSLSSDGLVSELQGMYRLFGYDFDFLRSFIHGHTHIFMLGDWYGYETLNMVFLYTDEWNWSRVE